MSTAAVILNGGSARRMAGRNKANLEIEGQSILQSQLAIVAQRFSPIAIAGDPTQTKTLPYVADRVGGLGPLDGITAALAWSPCPWLFVVASDMPYLSVAVIDTLLATREDASDIVVPLVDARPQPLFALYHKRLLPVFDRCLAAGELSLRVFLERPPPGVSVTWVSEASVRKQDPTLRCFTNLNSPADLRRAVGAVGLPQAPVKKS